MSDTAKDSGKAEKQTKTVQPAAAAKSASNVLSTFVEPWRALSVYVLTFLAQNMFILPIYFIVLIAYGINVDGLIEGDAIPDIPIGANMIIYASSVMIGLAGMAIYMKVKGIKPSQIGLKWPSVSSIPLTFAAFVVYFMVLIVVFVALETVLGEDILNEEQVTGFEDPSGLGEKIMAFIALVIIAPISEEIVYRGFLFHSFKQHISKVVVAAGVLISGLFLWSQLADTGSIAQTDIARQVLLPLAPVILALGVLFFTPESKLKAVPRWFTVTVAALVVSAFFGVAHGQLNVAVDTFILSLFMIGLTLKTGSIVPAIQMHMMKNGLAFYVLFINPEFLDNLGFIG